jgi:membrane protein implicated in regulation of membrane protease activity
MRWNFLDCSRESAAKSTAGCDVRGPAAASRLRSDAAPAKRTCVDRHLVRLLRRLLLAVVGLPIVIAVAVGVAALLAAVGDRSAAAVCGWIALAAGAAWTVAAMATVALNAIVVLSWEASRRRRRRLRRATARRVSHRLRDRRRRGREPIHRHRDGNHQGGETAHGA